MSDVERSWTLEVPRGWEASQDDAVVTLARPKGRSVVRVQLTVRSKGRMTEKDVRAAADAALGREASLRKATCGVFTGLKLEHQSNGRHRREWWLRAADLMLHVHYECPLADRGREDATVDGMLATLAIDPPLS
jgi:hypothetical protein